MQEQRLWEEEFLNKVYKKLEVVSENIKLLNPYFTIDGKYDNCAVPDYSWTCGFWGGIQWWLYLLSKEEQFLKRAKAASERMDAGLTVFTPLGHDVGFQYLLTTVADYIYTGSERARISGIHAATILAGRYNLAGKYIRAWNDGTGEKGQYSKAGYAIIDCMLNIPLLFWASEETGDPRYKQIAIAHADTTMKNHIRANGSSNHIVIYDPETGEVLDTPGGQGYAPGSSWTRGQSWAIYGFAIAYAYTGKIEYLETSLKVAKYFLSKLPENGVAPVDFDQPEEPAVKDLSANAISVCGMIELQNWVDEQDKEWLEEGIRKLFKGLYDNCDFSVKEQSIVQNCMESYHGHNGQVPLVYADFYLLEALMKRRGEGLLFRKQD